MSAPVACYSRKRKAWVVYDRPSKRDALFYANETMGPYRSRDEGLQQGMLPMVWECRDGEFETKVAAELGSIGRLSISGMANYHRSLIAALA